MPNRKTNNITTKAPESEGDIDPNGEPPVPAQLALKSFGEGEDCILSAFDGDIMEIAAQCTAANNFDQLISADGKITVAADNIGTDGNIYLVFKTGNWDGSFNDTMTLDNVVIKEII